MGDMNNHRPRPAFSRAILVIAGIVVFVLALVMVLVVVTIDRRLSRASGVLTIGYNDAAVNVQQHAQMIPYSPPIPTTGPSTLPGSSLAPLQP